MKIICKDKDDVIRTVRGFLFLPRTMEKNKETWEKTQESICEETDVRTPVTRWLGIYTWVQVWGWVDNEDEDGCMGEGWVNAYWVD